MSGFFLLFDATLDISYGKLISGKSTPISRGKRIIYMVKVSRVTAL